MGGFMSVASYIWPFSMVFGTGDTDVDPATGLSTRQKKIIRDTWGLVRKDLKSAGIGFFMAFFKAHPDYQLKFKAFANVPLDQLKDSPKLQAHAMNVMYTITLLVDSLDDVSCLVEQLKKIGSNHARHTIELPHFESLAVVLVNFLQEALGSQFTPEARQSWTLLLQVMNSIVAETLAKK